MPATEEMPESRWVYSAYAAVTTTIRLRFDGRSTTKVIKGHCDVTHQCPLTRQPQLRWFVYLVRSSCGRNECRRMVVARWNCSRMGVERRSNCSRIVVVTTAFQRTSRSNVRDTAALMLTLWDELRGHTLSILRSEIAQYFTSLGCLQPRRDRYKVEISGSIRNGNGSNTD